MTRVTSPQKGAARLRPPRRAPAIVAALLLSLGLHAASFGWANPANGPGLARTLGRTQVPPRPKYVDRDARELRRAWLTSGEIAAQTGALHAGEFLIVAQAIDDWEAGLEPNVERALKHYRDRQRTLREALRTRSPEDGIAHTLSDLGYAGTPGGTLAELFATGSGSCEPLSLLAAALLYDAGLSDRTRLRFYGTSSVGVPHVAALFRRSLDFIDLATQRPAEPSSSTFAVEDLPRIYKAARGLGAGRTLDAGAPESAGESAKPTDKNRANEGSGRPTKADRVKRYRFTLTGGYPPSRERFAGTLPLYAARAFRASGEPPHEPAPSERAPCALSISFDWLDPPSLEVGPSSAVIIRTPTPTELERLSSRIAAEEAAGPPRALAERLHHHSCLKGLYDRSAFLFSVAGKMEVAARASRRAQEEDALGQLALGEWARKPRHERLAILDALDDLSIGRSWTVITISGGEALVFERAEGGRSLLDRVWAIVALITTPRTRARAIALVEALELSEQIDVFHELAHARDHSQPWAATYLPDVEGPCEKPSCFQHVYPVFATLSHSLWGGLAAPEESVPRWVRLGRSHGLDEPTLNALAAYYLRNYDWLARRREGGPALVERAREAIIKAKLTAVPLVER